MFKNLCVPIWMACLLAMPAIAVAQTQYNYTGPTFNFVTSGGLGPNLTGYVILSSPLAPDSFADLLEGYLGPPSIDPRLVNFSFTDGMHTVTLNDVRYNPFASFIRMGTDSQGSIVNWSIGLNNVTNVGAGSGFIAFTQMAGQLDTAQFLFPDGSSYFAQVTDGRVGAWSQNIAPPANLHATVGNQMVYLYWTPPNQQIDGYHIYRDDGTRITEIDTTGAGSSFLEYGLTDGILYTYWLKSVKNGIESISSNKIYARPNQFAVNQVPPHPANPILFLHGLEPFEQLWWPCMASNKQAATWDVTKAFLHDTLHWQFGGELFNNGDTIGAQFRNGFVKGDFYTVSFGNPCANYTDGTGISHQGLEVGDFVSTLRRYGVKTPLNIVAHSMGGLAARAFLQPFPASTQWVYRLVTYGTPHGGGSWTAFDPFQVASDGVRDMFFTCRGTELVLSHFLYALNSNTLPDIRYTTIVGESTRNFFDVGGVSVPLPAHRMQDCHSSDWDGFVPADSADLSKMAHAPNSPIVVSTDRTHVQQTNDFGAILCALDPNCFIVNAHSPVSLDITAPDGKHINGQLSEIPGASFSEPSDGTSGSGTTVLIPFPINGDYAVTVQPKAGSLPTDTFSLDVIRSGVVTPLAAGQQIQNIPPVPYVVPVIGIMAIDIKPGSFPNSINVKSKGKIPVAFLSTSTFDAWNIVDRQSMTFGHYGDESSLAFCDNSAVDINGDGLRDLVCHFNAPQTGFVAGDTQGILKGTTIDGIAFTAADSVRIVP